MGIKLKDLLVNIKVQSNRYLDENRDILSIAFDSRKVVKDSLFVATRGTQVDGHNYIQSAIKKGATTIVCEEIPVDIDPTIVYIQVENSQLALGYIASNFYSNPSEKLQVIGVTGTNGKTSTTSMLYQLFTEFGYKVGLLSTIEIKIADEVISATHTTPNAISIQESMYKMVQKGCDYCFMEVSSHAIDQDRIAGIQFRGGLFTNITHDHLDYHLTFQNYIQAKKKYFDQLSANAFSLINLDDKNAKVMVQNTASKVKTMAMHSIADYTVKIIDTTLDYMVLKINHHEITLKVIGEFNAYNVLSSYAVACELGINQNDILLGLSKLNPVEGRIDIVYAEHSKVRGVIDYAHTPDAVEKLLIEINKINKNGQIITVIGCGGNRDKEKRPLMAQLAAQYSQRLILTSDNPRNENPMDIIQEMKLGLLDADMKKTLVVVDRAEAIKTACMLASEEDIIAVVGKGHEKYQEINGEKFPFDDKSCLKENMTFIIES